MPDLLPPPSPGQQRRGECAVAFPTMPHRDCLHSSQKWPCLLGLKSHRAGLTSSLPCHEPQAATSAPHSLQLPHIHQSRGHTAPSHISDIFLSSTAAPLLKGPAWDFGQLEGLCTALFPLLWDWEGPNWEQDILKATSALKVLLCRAIRATLGGDVGRSKV